MIRNSTELYSNSPNVGSSKFNAMAGSNGALGGDATSLLTNPAGLGVAISGDASVTLSVNSNKNTSSLAGSSVNYTANKTDIGNAGGVIAIPLMSKQGGNLSISELIIPISPLKIMWSLRAMLISSFLKTFKGWS